MAGACSAATASLLSLCLAVLLTPADALAQQSDLRGGVAPREVTIRLEGGVAAATYGEVIAELGRQRLITPVPEVDHAGRTPAKILADTGRLVGSTVAPPLEEYLCGVNPHVCARAAGGRFEWRNRAGSPDAAAPASGCGSRDLPLHVVCVPDVSVKTYRTTAVVPYDPRLERLPEIVVRKGSCEAFDERCQRAIRYLNKEDVLDPAYPGGRIRLPIVAYALTLPVDSSVHLERITRAVEAVRRTLAEQNALTRDQRSLHYTVPSATQRQTSHGPAAGGAPPPDPAALLARMRYPYLQMGSFPPALPRVIVGVWDSHVDDQHCGFKVTGPRAIILADNLPPADGDPPRPGRLASCGGVRAPLEERWDHGTHVAGVIAAQRNGSGAFGVNPRAALWVYEVDTRGTRLEAGDDPIERLGAQLDAATGIPPQLPAVVNLSFRQKTEDQPTRLEGLIEIYRQDTLFVTAAGNDNREIRTPSQCRIMPACLSADRDAGENVISVVALDQTGQDRWRDPADPARGSNYGPVFDVAAIGETVSTLYGNAYGVLQGTSVATPFVTGLASLIVARGRAPSPREVKERILGTVDFSDALDQLVAFGRINFDRALRLESDLLTLKGCADPACELRPVRVYKGPSEQLRVAVGLRDGRDLQQPVTIRVRDLRRLAAASDAPDAPYWIIYHDDTGVLRKIREARFEGTPQLRLRDGAIHPVSGIRDYVCSLACDG